MVSKTLYIGADHAGFALKEKVKEWLQQRKIPFHDVGAHVLDPQDDYPIYAAKVAESVVKKKSMGILICGSAQGVCIAANKISGIRAVVPFSVKEAQLTREHEDANVICLSGWYFFSSKAIRMLHRFVDTKFSGAPRHKRRLLEIVKLEEQGKNK